MKPILQYLAGRLTAIAVIVIVAYIGYNELFRRTGVDEKLDQALAQNMRAQQDLRYVEKQFIAQHKDLVNAQNHLDQLVCQVDNLSDSLTTLTVNYKAVSAAQKQQIAVSLDRYTQQKKSILDIQKQIK